MDVEINNVIYLELYSGSKMAHGKYGKMNIAGSIDRDSTVQRNMAVHSGNHCCSGKAMSITSACVFVALGIQHIKHMCHSHPCPALSIFFTLSHKQHDFRGWGYH
jgi:hypothetical protein